MTRSLSNAVALNPPERKQRLSNERVAEIGQNAAGMPHDVPVAGWLGDLCADLFDARALLAARDEENARLRRNLAEAEEDLRREVAAAEFLREQQR